MKKIQSLDELKEEILLLEAKRYQQEVELKEAFHDTMESMRLSNVIKNTAKDLANSSAFKSDLVNAGMSMTAGYLSKRLAFGSKGGVVKWLFGNLLQMGVSNVVAKNADSIKAGGLSLFQSFFRRKQHEEEDEHADGAIHQNGKH
ncbi:MAG TPA: hypothetical protein VK177_13725 [Flavobacteriales bacterium]|nr:hypothetical protein [Flavobacteriales bacterium]